MNSTLTIACAGSGKTTRIVEEVCHLEKTMSILITTFTDHNVETIKAKIREKRGYIPRNITILPWYSFELTDLIKPYQPNIIDEDIMGIDMKPPKVFYAKKGTKGFYLNAIGEIYKDRICDLVHNKCLRDKRTLTRLGELYNVIYIDEIQDFGGYDYENINTLVSYGLELHMYGDPRQTTFSTTSESKNSGYRNFFEFAKKNIKSLFIDETSLNHSYRCSNSIMQYASKLFPEYSASSGKESDGRIYFVKESDLDSFYKSHPGCVRLQYQKAKEWREKGIKAFNFGECKGDTFDSVIVFLTKDATDAIIKDNLSSIKADLTRAKCYVSLTRSRGDVGIIIKDAMASKITNPEITLWKA